MSEIAIEIKDIREKLGLTQFEFGIKLGLSPQSAAIQVNYYESGKHEPRSDRMETIRSFIAE